MKTKIYCDCLYTADVQGNYYTRAAIVIQDERIAWVGDADACPLADGDADRLIRADGYAAIPGLVNGHGHSNLNAWRGASDAADFETWARELSPYTANLSPADIANSNVYSVAEMLRNGITCICDCTRYEAGQLAEACATFGMRCVAGGLANSPEFRADGRPNYEAIYRDTKNYQSRFKDNPLIRFYLGAHSPYSCTEQLLQMAYRASAEFPGPFVIHAAESKHENRTILERYGMRPIQWLDHLGVLSERTLLVHCVEIDAKDVDTIARRGCAVVHCPASNAKLGNGIAPLQNLLQAGITAGIGTDSMLSNDVLDLFREMKAAALLQRVREPGKSIPTENIVRLATSDGAKALGWADSIGSLEKGKYADIVFLGLGNVFPYTKKRFLSDMVYYFTGKDVQMVWVAGQQVYGPSGYMNPGTRLALDNMQSYFARRNK